MTPRPTADEIRSIYEGIELLPIGLDLQGWNSTSGIFEDVIDATRPRTIVEVGSWKGASAIHMVKLAAALHLDTVIYAVDCWLPPIGVWLGEIPRTQIPARWDHPGLYEQFLYNVKASECDHRIIPVRGLTTCSAWLLQAWEIQADLVYIDASHDEASAFADIEAYWPVLRHGGVMFGDDLSKEGVRKAVNGFSLKSGRAVREVTGPEAVGSQWILEAK